ncbi:hypothetical protein [Winogradskyella pacifica]|jgi:hypothetical protein|uniref:Uncharacterized protein n=1 Tax=Winogradskyella pacifica TaxID=664642 RepID=A0A3D9N7P5_9FLAO|nr:hypothetical protein [Winogradskyella pacifica]REE27476.1 hypothetical protein DFQ09_101307 [Winogradskyella pacifica]
MIKTLFSILLFLASLGTSAHACDTQLLNSDLESSLSIDSSNEIAAYSTTHHSFFDIQTENYSVVFFNDTEPSRVDRVLENSNGITNRSKHLSAVLRSQFSIAEPHSFNTLYLREILFPFHSFW